MGRAPCCDKANVKKGPWSPEEDEKLKSYIEKHGTGGNWIALPQKIGLKRCGKSCRLRWLNYLRPNIKHGAFSEEEDSIICSLYIAIGSRWSIMAAQLPGRTDNDIKNHWNTKLKKRLLGKQRKGQHQSLRSRNQAPIAAAEAGIADDADQLLAPNTINPFCSGGDHHHLIRRRRFSFDVISGINGAARRRQVVAPSFNVAPKAMIYESSTATAVAQYSGHENSLNEGSSPTRNNHIAAPPLVVDDHEALIYDDSLMMLQGFFGMGGAITAADQHIHDININVASDIGIPWGDQMMMAESLIFPWHQSVD